MKNIVLCLGLLGFTTGTACAQAPIKAGTVALGGGLNYNNNNSQLSGGVQSGTNNAFRFSPSVGYFVADNLSLGLDIVVQTTRNTGNYLSLGPAVQKYQMLTDQFGFTGTLGAGYARLTQTSSYGGPDFNYNGLYASLTPGLIFLPIPRLGLGASIGSLRYDFLSGSPTSGTGGSSSTQSSFNTSFGLDQLTFSGTYFFGR